MDHAVAGKPMIVRGRLLVGIGSDAKIPPAERGWNLAAHRQIGNREFIVQRSVNAGEEWVFLVVGGVLTGADVGGWVRNRFHE